jgi:tetratricopeptide (TPR) repeat protein
MFSVCTGAFVLARAGLLDGLEATTHASSISGLKEFPRIKVRERRRVVDNGKIVTAAGVSAGIDGALHLVARYCGLETAKQTATYMQYRWQPETGLQSVNEPLSTEVAAAHSWFAGKWVEAEQSYQGIVARQPRDGVALHRLGVCQFRNRRYEAAARSLEEAVQNGHRDGGTFSMLGVVQFRLRRVAAAAEAFERALKTGAQEAFIHYHLARIYAASGAKDKALTALEQAFDNGIDNVSQALLEPDFDNVRGEKCFRDVIHKYSYDSKIALVTDKEPGDSLVVTGVVRDADGQPIPGAVVYVCQTDARGYYSANQVGSDMSPRLFAYLRTDGDGSYEVRTIRPAGHPNSQIPPHIHYEVSATGHRKFVSDFLFADEPQLKGNDRKHAERTRSLVTISRDPGGVQRCVIDATLPREGG